MGSVLTFLLMDEFENSRPPSRSYRVCDADMCPGYPTLPPPLPHKPRHLRIQIPEFTDDPLGIICDAIVDPCTPHTSLVWKRSR